MSLELLANSGVPLDKQVFTWRDLAGVPLSKVDHDALTRTRIISMAALEAEASRFGHGCARMNRALRLPLAQVRRVEQHQQTLLRWMLPTDFSPLEMTLAQEQSGIELTATLARQEPNKELAQVFRFVLLEDVDHLYRLAALFDRLDGQDANAFLQNYTEIVPARPSRAAHRAPEDELRDAYDARVVNGLSKLNVRTVLAVKHQVYQHCMDVGAQFGDVMARQLYAEMASIKEQHLTQYGSLLDCRESWLTKWLLQEACEAYNYYCCMTQETNARTRALWERFLDYELGQLHFVKELFERHENRDAAEVLPASLPNPAPRRGQREFIRQTVESERHLRAAGARIIDQAYELSEAAGSVRYRDQLNRDGSPSDKVAANYRRKPGRELASQPFSDRFGPRH